MSTFESAKVKEVIVDSRINKVLAMRTDSVAMLEALDAISEFYGKDGNTVDARRALRQDLEMQNINLAKKFLVEYGEVRNRIESAELLARNLETSCQVLSARLSSADYNMKTFMEKAAEIENSRNYYIAQSNEITNFLHRFQLSAEEIETLYQASIDDPANARSFFEALQRLKVSYADCKAMAEKHKYTAGFELLDALGQHQNVAYQRLFEWVKQKCDNAPEPTSSAPEDIDVKLQVAIRFLRELPAYFSQCQELIITSRRSQLVQRFVLALTQGGHLGQSFRAIDMHAHDSVRYVGDMLAWMHQAIASEAEFLEAVFAEESMGNIQKKSSSRRLSRSGVSGRAAGEDSKASEGSADRLEMTASGATAVRSIHGFSQAELLIRCIQGLGRPLRVRITQTLEARTGLETLYPLTDLLSFYEQTLFEIVPLENAVHSAVKGCLLECKRLFMASLNKQAETLVQNPSSYPLDLTATVSTRDCARQIKEILRVHATALSGVSSDSLDECCVENVLSCIVQPLLQSCRVAAQALKGGDMAIFLLNNVYLIKHELDEASVKSESCRQAVSSWLEQLHSEANTWIDILVQEETSRTLRRSDLDKLLDLAECTPVSAFDVAGNHVGAEGTDASYDGSGLPPALSAERVAGVLRAFYSSLFSSMTPQFDRLQDPDMRELTRYKTADAIAAAYETVCNFVHRGSRYYDVSILAHTVEEVRVLLGVSK